MVRFRATLLGTALALALGSLALAAPVAAPTRVVVTESDIARQAEGTLPTKNWVLYTRNAGTGTFRQGPGTPPAGVGSLEFVTPTGADKVYLFNYDHIGTRLADINALGYATYRTAGTAQQVTAINLEVDFNGPNVAGGFTTLVFEPVYNTDQGAVTSGVWQTWDAYRGGNAIWWSTRAIPGVCARDCFVTWNTIVQNNPNATILGGIGLNQGSGNPALTAAADALTIGYGSQAWLYDLEPYRVATSQDACKDGGWQQLRRADGTPFKNQGDCIQYVNTGK